MLVEVEALGHPATPRDAAAKGDALEISFEIVSPGMVDTGQIVGVAAPLEADEVAPMGAAVQHGMDFAIMPAGHDDRGLAEKGREIVAWHRQLAGQRRETARWPEKDSVSSSR